MRVPQELGRLCVFVICSCSGAQDVRASDPALNVLANVVSFSEVPQLVSSCIITDRDRLPFPPSQESSGRWSHDIIEDTRTPDQKRKAEDLQPFERLPAETQTDDPDEERTASVDRAA